MSYSTIKKLADRGDLFGIFKKEMRRYFVLLLIAVVIAVIGGIVSAWWKMQTTKTELIKVESFTSKHITFELYKGDWIKCVFAVTSKPNDINFYVVDPLGKKIVNLKGVSSYTCTIKAELDGGYTFVFDNSKGFFDRLVSVTWKSNRRFSKK